MIERIAVERRQKLRLVALQSQLDRIRPEHWNERLILERMDARITPRECRQVRHVREAHAPARMHLVRRAHGARSPVGECERLLVAAPARAIVRQRHPFVVEEATPELHLHGAHWIVGGDRRLRKCRRDVPVEIRQPRGCSEEHDRCTERKRWSDETNDDSIHGVVLSCTTSSDVNVHTGTSRRNPLPFPGPAYSSALRVTVASAS